MNKSLKKHAAKTNTIALNRKARHEYSIIEDFEAGIVLEGWEVKSLRANLGQISESYVIIRKNEAWLLNANMTPLISASTHIVPDRLRARKLLLKHKEILKYAGLIEKQGYTLVGLALYWKNALAKLKVGLAKGKKQIDKRADQKDKDWLREKSRLIKAKRN